MDEGVTAISADQASPSSGDTVALIASLREKIKERQAAVEIANKTIIRMKERLSRRDEAVSFLKTKLTESRQQERSVWEARRDAQRRLAPYQIVIEMMRFAQACANRGEELWADAYIAHDPRAFIGADLLAKEWGGRRICDVIEHPSLEERRMLKQRWPAEARSIVDASCATYLRQCDALMTVGESLAQLLPADGRQIHIVPNYRNFEPFRRDDELRQRCGVSADDTLLLSIGTTTGGLENVLLACKSVSESVHVATLGAIVPSDYRRTVLSFAGGIGLGRRVHLLDPVPYERLAGIAAGADGALVVLSPEEKSHFIALPNRVFDFLAAGLPFCSPRLPDVAGLIEKFGVGVVAEDSSPEGWAKAIKGLLQRRAEMHQNALSAAAELTWESCEEKLLAAVGEARRVTILSMKDLTSNNRTRRMACSLAEHGVAVTVCTRADPSLAPAWHPRVSFCLLDLR